ncbi:hypothetical protein GS930_09750 [Rhodococcus hoagii]|nr:hypothetical protein [Prescottella equi]
MTALPTYFTSIATAAVSAARLPDPRNAKLCRPPAAAMRRVNWETQNAMRVTAIVATRIVTMPLTRRSWVSIVSGRITMDTAGAVVATDCASTSTPDSCRRPRARIDDRAGRSGSPVVNERAIASVSADTRVTLVSLCNNDIACMLPLVAPARECQATARRMFSVDSAKPFPP